MVENIFESYSIYANTKCSNIVLSCYFFQIVVSRLAANNSTMKNTTNITNGTSSDGELISSTGNIVAVFFVALLIVLTLLGNVVVCACFYCFRELRTICNYFIISLSVADILVALLAMPLWLLLQLYYPSWWGPFKIGEILIFWNWVDVFVCVSSIMNLVAVSFDRQLAITQPFSYNETLTSFRALLMIAGVWSYAFIVAVLSPIYDMTRNLSPVKWYSHFLLGCGFLLPLFIMIIMYVRIFYVARRQARRIGRNLASDIKAAKTIAIVVGAFILCWGPFIVLVEGFALDPDFTKPQVTQAMKWLAYLNSCLNPLIYTCFNRAYRCAVYRLLTQRIMRGSHSRRRSSHASPRSSFQKTRDQKSDSLCGSSSSGHENGQILKAKPSLVTTCLMGSRV